MTTWPDVAVAVADRLNPLVSGPGAPLETIAGLDAFGPSLMPRSSVHQGVAAGLALLAARASATAVEHGTRRLLSPRAGLGPRLAARAIVGGAAFAARRLPEQEGESNGRAALRAGGRIVSAAALGGALHDVTLAARERYPAHGPRRPLVGGAAMAAITLGVAQRRLHTRNAVIERWTAADEPAHLLKSLAIAAAINNGGTALGRGFVASRRASIGYFGSAPLQQVVARSLNAAAWGAGATALYWALISRTGRSNERVEAAYATPPASPLRSGGPGSVSPFDDLGLQGRRYVTDVVTPELIEQVMGEPAVADPIRVFVGFDTDPLYPSGRAELALDELERTGAFDRSYLLLVSPTGTGWIDQTMIESAELLARGDIATCTIQYARYPSFLSVQKVALGRGQFRQLLWGVRQRLLAVEPDRRPTVLVFGESLGAWTSSDVVMKQGIAGFDHYGIDRALWVGLPGMAQWSKSGMRRGAHELVPPGTVAAFDRAEELAELSPEERTALRAVILDHDNDPIAVMAGHLALRPPDWLADGRRGRNVPDGMTWVPLITLTQIIVDAMNAMRVVPGEFKSFGHDYRGDMCRFVHAAFGLPPATDEQLAAVEAALRELELDRGRRIGAADDESGTAAPAPAPAGTAAG